MNKQNFQKDHNVGDISTAGKGFTGKPAVGRVEGVSQNDQQKMNLASNDREENVLKTNMKGGNLGRNTFEEKFDKK